MGYVDISTTSWPDDVDGMFLDLNTPGDITVIIAGRVYTWPWSQAREFATHLAYMTGRAEIRALKAARDE